ncbi:hypothetical protein BH09VER1_BH09VER1_49120 [soil metagenome]
MRALLILLAAIAVGVVAIYYGLMAQPPPVVAKAQPTPVPTPVSTLPGLGEGATLLGPSRPLEHIDMPGTIVPQSSKPKH